MSGAILVQVLIFLIGLYNGAFEVLESLKFYVKNDT